MSSPITRQALDQILVESSDRDDPLTEPSEPGYYLFDYREDDLSGPYEDMYDAARKAVGHDSKILQACVLQRLEDGWYIILTGEEDKKGPYPLDRAKKAAKRATEVLHKGLGAEGTADALDAFNDTLGGDDDLAR